MSDPEQFDEFIHEQLTLIKSSYRQTGSSETALLAAELLVDKFNGVPVATRSVQFARLLTFICDLRIGCATTRDDLESVKATAEKSIEVLFSASKTSKEQVGALASANLYIAVALKASDKKDEAFESIRRAKREMRKYFDTDYRDEILLTRQEVLMKQDQKSFLELLDQVPKYLDLDPVEGYASVKRVFEYCLNKGYMQAARQLFPTLKSTFRLASPTVSHISKISFQKNVGQFLLLNNEVKKARRVLSIALRHAEALGFGGQSAQIKLLLDEIGGNNTMKLSVFKIDK